jgi:ribose transport system substrate-binding protein/inositol transport system substrate-binding protein
MAKELFERSINRRTLVKGVAGTAAAAALMPVSSRVVSAQDTLKIAFSVPGLNFPFFVHMMDLAEAHANSIGGIEFIRLDGQESGQPSSTKQSADLEAVVSQGVSGIVISPNDVNALQPAIQAAIDAGIPVVTVDRNVTGATTLAHVGADNVEGGRVQGRYLVEILPDGGDVFELQGAPGASAAIDRHTGFNEIMQGQDKIKVVVSQTAQFQRAPAVSVTESALAVHPEPKAVVAANDEMAFGASEALADAGVTAQVVGFDALPEALVAINEGRMAATIEQFPGGQAAGAIDILVAFLRDGTTPAAHDTWLTPALITKDNIAEAERAVEAGVAQPATPTA